MDFYERAMQWFDYDCVKSRDEDREYFLKLLQEAEKLGRLKFIKEIEGINNEITE